MELLKDEEKIITQDERKVKYMIIPPVKVQLEVLEITVAAPHSKLTLM